MIRAKKEQGGYFEEKKKEMDLQDKEDASEQEKIIYNIRQLHLEEMYVKRREFE